MKSQQASKTVSKANLKLNKNHQIFSALNFIISYIIRQNNVNRLFFIDIIFVTFKYFHKNNSKNHIYNQTHNSLWNLFSSDKRKNIMLIFKTKRVYHNFFIKGVCTGTDECPSTINPVCGTNGMTYFNLCLLERSSAALGEGQSIEVLHNGPCPGKNFFLFHFFFPIDYTMLSLPKESRK